MKAIRYVLGKLILLLNAMFPPKSMVNRSPEQQQKVDQRLSQYSLYQFEACPFCVKVRRHAKRLHLNLHYKDAKNDPAARQDLKDHGGKIQVPCLRIKNASSDQDQWLYESNAIIAYLDQHFI